MCRMLQFRYHHARPWPRSVRLNIQISGEAVPEDARMSDEADDEERVG